MKLNVETTCIAQPLTKSMQCGIPNLHFKPNLWSWRLDLQTFVKISRETKLSSAVCKDQSDEGETVRSHWRSGWTAGWLARPLTYFTQPASHSRFQVDMARRQAPSPVHLTAGSLPAEKNRKPPQKGWNWGLRHTALTSLQEIWNAVRRLLKYSLKTQRVLVVKNAFFPYQLQVLRYRFVMTVGQLLTD